MGEKSQSFEVMRDMFIEAGADIYFGSHCPQPSNKGFESVRKMIDSSVCEHCKRKQGKLVHQHTMYERAWMNIVRLCNECEEENDKFWQEQWDQYYSRLL